jgi:cyclopropane fatty-acyl-phospholipid synthase-like methyltransferase
MDNPTDWNAWVRRFDKMQDRYPVRRQERFSVIAAILRSTQGEPKHVIDLGCGTGSLTQAILEAFPACCVSAVDLDKSLLLLAEERLRKYGSRVEIIRRDLRDDAWFGERPSRYEAAVSATALHWLSAGNLAKLYRQVALVLKPGGVFLSADHVSSEDPRVQESWEQHRAAVLKSSVDESSDTWEGFFEAYARAIGADPQTIGSNAVEPWEGVEQGMPLAWHFDRLLTAGFIAPECFWRCDCDAIYGAFLPKEG